MKLSYTTCRFQVYNSLMYQYFAETPAQALNLGNDSAKYSILGNEWKPIEKEVLEAKWSVKRMKEDCFGNADYAIIAEGFLTPVNGVLYQNKEDAEEELKALLRK